MTTDRSGAGKVSPLTITVRSLRACHEGAEVLLQLLIENGEHREQKSLMITTEQYCTLKPQKGQISESTYEALEAASAFCNALRAGENLLSYGANSVQMLSRKLVLRGYSKEVALTAAEYLKDRGLIDEEGDLRRETEKCLRKLWGAKRIQSYLWSRGFSNETLATLPELLEKIDFSKVCASLIRKKYGIPPTDRDEYRRMVASLSRYGYSLSEIRAACGRVAGKSNI